MLALNSDSVLVIIFTSNVIAVNYLNKSVSSLLKLCNMRNRVDKLSTHDEVWTTNLAEIVHQPT